MLKADVVAKAESIRAVTVNVRWLPFRGVCVVGMYEKTQPRNLGDPAYSLTGKHTRNRLQGCVDSKQEVRWLHSVRRVAH